MILREDPTPFLQLGPSANQQVEAGDLLVVVEPNRPFENKEI